MTSPVEQVGALTIGTVEFVSPTEIKVLLETDAPQAVALNTGVPTGFPRINGYVLIPNETGAVVGMIVWLGVERSAFPKRTGLKDFGLVDLPFPSRKLALTPVGTLVKTKNEGVDNDRYRLERGVRTFPSVGDPVLLPTVAQLMSIIEAGKEEDQRVLIGTSPLAFNARITVDPNKIFARHLAVLGNTGSGKSCSVAGLIRWSLEAAANERRQAEKDGNVNARFIILDPNGEYSTAFDDLTKNGEARVFRVPPVTGENVKELVLPAWMWNSQEWCAFTEASSKVQRPILMCALRELRTVARAAQNAMDDAGLMVILRQFHRAWVKDLHTGPEAYMDFPGKQNFGQKLKVITESITTLCERNPERKGALGALKDTLSAILDKRRVNQQGYYPAFSLSDVEIAIQAIEETLQALPTLSEKLGINEDSPMPFDAENLPELIEQIALEQGQTQHVDTLLLRVRMLLSDEHLRPVVSPENVPTLATWLGDFIGKASAQDGQLAILDLSLIPSDVLHTVIAVIARIVFEAMQRYRRIYPKELPTVLVLEEAHTFVRRGSDQEEGNPTPTQMCRQTFERIAREGRKYGLGLVLSSQRPSELSPTVLAQCNTFLLHRIVNDRDQELVGKLVPDNLGGLLRELPSLPSRQAILLGWAAEVPALVEIGKLPEAHRPRSADPEFWKVWTGEEERPIDWSKIVTDWTGE